MPSKKASSKKTKASAKKSKASSKKTAPKAAAKTATPRKRGRPSKSAAKKTTARVWDWREGLSGRARNRKNPFPTMDEIESNHIQALLDAYGHDIQQTARALGIARSTVYRKMKRYQIK